MVIVKSVRSVIFAFTCSSLGLLALGSLAYAQNARGAVRVLDPTLAATLHHASQASPTLRALVDELEQSDVIVHVVRMGPRIDDRLGGSLAFVHAANGRRLLRITVNPRLAPLQRAAVLGHELQHAVEVARAGWVISAATLANLYQQIGYPVPAPSRSQWYESHKARGTADMVLRDLKQARAAARLTGSY